MEHANLADPGFEPSDEQLAELMHRAFEDATAKHLESLRRFHEQIARDSSEVLRQWKARSCNPF